jgi:cytochrome b6-f complex iron-sulfur subunit
MSCGGTMNTPIQRRDFLKLAGGACLALSGLLGAGGLLRLIAYPGEPAQPTEFDLGSAASYPPGSRTILPEANVLLVHTPGGFQAIGLTCTHLGCTVRPNPGGFACPCHNSRFDQDGKVIHGPASRPLEVYPLKITADGRLALKIPA